MNIEDIIVILKELEPGESKEHEVPGHEEHTSMEFKLLTNDGKIIYATEEYEFFENISNDLSSFILNRKVETGDYFVAEGDKPDEGDELYAYTHSKGYI